MLLHQRLLLATLYTLESSCTLHNLAVPVAQLADRLEDVTPPERIEADPKCDREVALFGYLRGANLRPGTRMHLAGAGDYDVSCRSPAFALLLLQPRCGRYARRVRRGFRFERQGRQIISFLGLLWDEKLRKAV